MSGSKWGTGTPESWAGFPAPPSNWARVPSGSGQQEPISPAGWLCTAWKLLRCQVSSEIHFQENCRVKGFAHLTILDSILGLCTSNLCRVTFTQQFYKHLFLLTVSNIIHENVFVNLIKHNIYLNLHVPEYWKGLIILHTFPLL